MLIAYDSNNQIVHAKECTNDKRKGSFHCPSCKSPVYLKKGSIRMAHFSHFQSSNCLSFSEGETWEHLSGKELLLDVLLRGGIQAELEVYLPELQQRPDLFLPDFQVAIEFQCSYLPPKRMVERTETYQKKGIQVVWIVGKKFWLTHKLTAFQKLFVQTTFMNQPYYLQLDVEKEIFTYFYSLKYEPFSRKQFSLKEGTNVHRRWKELLTLSGSLRSYKNSVSTLRRVHQQLQRNRYWMNQRFHHDLYTSGETIISLPIECYVRVAYEWLFNQPPVEWKYRVLRWVEEKEKNERFTLCEVVDYLEKHPSELLILQSPLLDENLTRLPFIQFFQHLSDRGVLATVGAEEWVFLKKAQRFQREEDKLAAFTTFH